MRRPPILHSGFVHAVNLATGVVIMVSCVYFFDWELYGQVSLVIALSFLATQVVVVGNPSLMIASLTRFEFKYHSAIVKSFKKEIFKPYLFVVVLLLSIILLMRLFGKDNFSNLSLYGLIAICVSTLFSPINKIALTSLTLPNYYSKFVAITITRNLIVISFVVTSILTHSQLLMISAVAFTELILFPILFSLERIVHSSMTQIALTNGNICNRRDQASAFFITIYFELLGKYDFYIFSVTMNPKIFGVYALISNVNESIQTYLGAVRTQVTPYFTNEASTSKKDLKEILLYVKIILLSLVISGYFFVSIIFQSTGVSLDSWSIYFLLIIVSTLMLFNTLIYGGIYVQRGESPQLARIAAIHIGFLFVTFTLASKYFGFIPALLAAIFINYFFSKFIFTRTPKAGNVE